MGTRTLRINNNAELLSYMINTVPELSDIDLPVEGESTAKYGELIMDCDRYKNAFINTINLIGLTLVKRNEWENPWEDFTNRGTLKYGQQIREMIQDLAQVFDYRENLSNKTKFLETFVPNVFTYIHEVNFEKVYPTTINESLLLMAFDSEEGLLDFIAETVGNLYESFKYDKYQVDKYQLCRRFLAGTVPVVKIDNYDSLTPRQILTKMKSYSNKMIFKKPFYNPAGVRRATKFEKQITMLDTESEAEYTTEVLATSYFKNEAEMKSRLALIDGYNEFDEARLSELLGNDYVPFTDSEKEQLSNVIGNIISDEWFMDYYKKIDSGNSDGKKQIEFINPTTLERNIFLHVQMVISTSPYENCIVFVKNTPAVSSVSVSPSTATVSKGQTLQLNSIVATTGLANKAVTWEQDGGTKAHIDLAGKLTIDSDFDNTGSGTAGVYDIEIATILETGDKVTVNGITYTVDASSEDTIAKQITALKSALNVATITDNYTIGGTSPHCTLTEKSGKYGLLPVPVVTLEKASGSSGAIDFETTTEGKHAGNIIVVTATSVYDNTKKGTARITVA